MTQHQIEELMEVQERLSLAMDAGNLCSWEIDLSNQRLTHSPNAADILGFAVPETFEAIVALVHPEDRDRVDRAGQDTILRMVPFDCEYRMINPQSGTVSWFHSQGGVKTSLRTGRLIFVGVSQNITEKKEGELMRRELESVLQIRGRELQGIKSQSGFTREKYEALFRSMDEGFCLLDKIETPGSEEIDFRFVDVNPAFGKLTGVPDATGRRVRDVFPVEAEEWTRFYEQVFRTGRPVKFEGDLLSTGHQLESYTYLVPNNPLPQLAVILIDITARKMRERDEEFVSEISHQLTRIQDAEEIMQVLGARLGWHGGFSRCLFIEVQPDGESVWVNRHWQQHGVPVLKGFFPREIFIADEDLPALQQDSTIIVRKGEQNGKILSKTLIDFGVQTAMTFSFFRDQKLSFLVCLTDQQQKPRTEREIDLARTVAARLWMGVERCRFEKTLQKSETRLQKAVAIETVGVMFFNPRGKFVDVNDAFCHFTGYSRAELCSGKMGWENLTPPEWIDKCLKTFEDLKRTGHATPFEKQYLRKDGSRIWVLVAGSRISDTETVAYVIDVTARREAVEALISSEAEQRKITTRLNLALDAGKLGSFDYHLSNGAITCSAQCKQNFGLGERDFLNFDRLLSLIVPEDREQVVNELKKAVELNQEYHAEYRVRKPDGSLTWIRASGKPVYENDIPVRVVGTTRDVLEEKDFAEALNRQVRERTLELNRSNQDLLQFAHVASHDLKEPVRKVRIFTSMLREELGPALTDAAAAHIERIQKATDRMISMIDGVLSYSMHTAAQDVFGLINLNDIVRQIVLDLELQLQEKNAVVRFDALPHFVGTEVLIYQLFYNLIFNALKFSRKNTAPRIGIDSVYETDGNQEWVVIRVTDNGIGLEEEFNEKIFESFVRLNTKSEYEGTGLGLSLCRKIVDRHKGSISAKGIPGEGSVFTVRLPTRQF